MRLLAWERWVWRGHADPGHLGTPVHTLPLVHGVGGIKAAEAEEGHSSQGDKLAWRLTLGEDIR